MKLALPVLDTGGRSCGTCSLCCTTMEVSEIPKEKHVKCGDLSPLGRCGIYATRPDSCRKFRCLWLSGFLPLDLLPSKVRAVANTNPAGDTIVFHILPQDAGAHRRGPLARFIARCLQYNVDVIVVTGDKRSLFSTNEALRAKARGDGFEVASE